MMTGKGKGKVRSRNATVDGPNRRNSATSPVISARSASPYAPDLRRWMEPVTLFERRELDLSTVLNRHLF